MTKSTVISTDYQIPDSLLSRCELHAPDKDDQSTSSDCDSTQTTTTMKRPIDELPHDHELLGGAPLIVEEPLKTAEGNSTSTTDGKQKRTISFAETVVLIHIPSHQLYNKKMKKLIWSTSQQIKMNAQRNLREFASEGWDWKKVVEEDDMYFDKFSNEWIHPIHMGGIMNVRRMRETE